MRQFRPLRLSKSKMVGRKTRSRTLVTAPCDVAACANMRLGHVEPGTEARRTRAAGSESGLIQSSELSSLAIQKTNSPSAGAVRRVVSRAP